MTTPCTEKTRSFVQLILLTARRAGEGRFAVWSDFDLGELSWDELTQAMDNLGPSDRVPLVVWDTPEARLKMVRGYRTPLSRQAVQVLLNLRRFAPAEVSAKDLLREPHQVGHAVREHRPQAREDLPRGHHGPRPALHVPGLGLGGALGRGPSRVRAGPRSGKARGGLPALRPSGAAPDPDQGLSRLHPMIVASAQALISRRKAGSKFDANPGSVLGSGAISVRV